MVYRTLVSNADFPISLAVAPDGTVYYSELHSGNIRALKNDKLVAQPVTNFSVPSSDNEGLQGIALSLLMDQYHLTTQSLGAPFMRLGLEIHLE